MIGPLKPPAGGDPSRTRGMLPAGNAAPVQQAPGEDPKVRKVAQQLEGVFVQELYKAMRATVPQNEGVVGGGAGEEMFTGLMDQHLATETPHAWGRGLGEAIYQHLRGRLAREGATPDAAHDAAHDAPQATQRTTDPTAPAALAPTPTPLSLRSTLQPMLLTPSRDAGR